jgi:hypothetical protein
MKDNSAPEERLLRLIRGSQKKEALAPARNIQSLPEQKPEQAPSLWGLVQPHLLFIRTYRVQRILLVALIIACVFFIASVVYPLLPSAPIIEIQPNAPQEAAQPEQPRPQQKPLDYYAQVIKGRQIFSSALPVEADAPARIAGTDLTKDINLLGVVTGDAPEAVVEDTKANKVYYVKRGMLIGDYRVDEIQESKVIVSRNGQRFELHL